MSIFDWTYFKTQWRNKNYSLAFQGLWEDFKDWFFNQGRLT
jgi:hypothetical protein